MRWEELVQAWVSISLSYVLYIMYLEEVGQWHCTHANLIALLIPGVHSGVLVKRRERPVAVFQMIILKQVRSGAKTWIIRRCSCGWDEWPKFDFFYISYDPVSFFFLLPKFMETQAWNAFPFFPPRIDLFSDCFPVSYSLVSTEPVFPGKCELYVYKWKC